MLNEREACANTPMEIFPGVSVSVLPIAKADAWYVLAAKVEVADGVLQKLIMANDADGMQDARKQFRDAIYKCVCAYSEDLNLEKLSETVTPKQMAAAFFKLRESTDPFEACQSIILANAKVTQISDALISAFGTQTATSD